MSDHPNRFTDADYHRAASILRHLADAIDPLDASETAPPRAVVSTWVTTGDHLLTTIQERMEPGRGVTYEIPLHVGYQGKPLVVTVRVDEIK